MSSSSSLLPFELRRLSRPVFAPSLNSIDDQSFQSPLAGASKNPVIRSVDGHGQLLWVGSSDGRVKGLDIKAQSPDRRIAHSRVASDAIRSPELAESRPRPRSASGRLSKPSSPRLPSDPTGVEASLETSCFQDCQVFPATDKSKPKAIEKLILVPMIGLAIILSEGALTFHSITDLQPYPASSFPTIRGVSAVTLDENSYQSENIESGQPDVLMCVIKKKSILLYLLSMSGLRQVHEVPFISAAFQSLLRGSTLLLSDIEQYYLLSLEDEPPEVVPLLPISQTSAPAADVPSTTTSQASRHRPSMAAIPNSQEFLLASHTGSTCLGIFVSSSGEPSRGTLEWPSNPRSLSVDLNHVVALLFNGTIQVHLLATQQLVHVIQLPTDLDPRFLASVKFGISLPGESYTSQLNTTSFSLGNPPQPSLPAARNPKSPSRESPISVATHSRILLVGRDSLYALATRTLLADVETLIKQHKWDEVLAVANRLSTTIGRNSRSESTPHPRAHALQSERSGQITQLNYIYQKIALHYFFETRFEEAGNLWFKGRGDPRIFLQLFPRLVANKLFKADSISIFSGLEEMIRDLKSADELITINLVRNYSPHIKPDIDTALPTVDLKGQLEEKARQALLKYLRLWRRDRLLKGGASDSNRHLDSIVDTALVQILSERRQIDPEGYSTLKQLLERPNSCAFSDIQDILLENKCFFILGEAFLKRGDIPHALDIWAKLHDGRFSDVDFHDDLDRMASILLNHDQVDLVWKYTSWMASLDHHLAVTILVNSKVSDSLNVEEAFGSLYDANHQAAELYLEQIILRESSKMRNDKRQTSRLQDEEVANRLIRLRTKLILGYLKKLKDFLTVSSARPPPSMNFFRQIVEKFFILAKEQPTECPCFIDFLVPLLKPGLCPGLSPDSSDDSLSPQCLDALNTRLKLISCLDQSNFEQPDYDAHQVRTTLEDMGGSAEILALERAMVYSSIDWHRPALSLLAITLKDVRSAETYCLQNGRLLSSTQRSKLTAATQFAILNLKPQRSPSASLTSTSNKPSTDELIEVLFDILVTSSNNQDDDRFFHQVQSLLSRHPSRIPLLKSIPRLPDEWMLDSTSLNPYLARSIRRSNHLHHESTIIKSIALGHRLSLAISWENRKIERVGK